MHVLWKQGVSDKLLATDNTDPLSKQHLESCQQDAGCQLLGIGFWADGAPCNWDRSETVDTLAMSLPGLGGEFRNMRIPVTALSHKHVADETWVDICAVVKWSLQILATGVWPTCRHDGTPWRKSDCKRTAARTLQRSCVVEIRADWDWMSKVYGFPAHNVLEGMCWKCKCQPHQVTGEIRKKLCNIWLIGFLSLLARSWMLMYIHIYYMPSTPP